MPRPLGHHRGGRDGGQSHWLAHHVYAGTGPVVNFRAQKLPGVNELVVPQQKKGQNPSLSEPCYMF